MNGGVPGLSSKPGQRSLAARIVVPAAIALFVVLWVVLYQLAGIRVAAQLVLGAGLGFALHRSRFCFAAAFRDLILFRDTSIGKAVVLSLAVSTVGFAVIQFHAVTAGRPLPGNLFDFGPYTAIGAMLFGSGMVMAGGCVCSMLLRLGEGFILGLVVLTGLLAGSLLGAYHLGWWMTVFKPLPAVFLPDRFGWLGGLALQLLVLGSIFIGLRRLEK